MDVPHAARRPISWFCEALEFILPSTTICDTAFALFKNKSNIVEKALQNYPIDFSRHVVNSPEKRRITAFLL
jgi:hypothetical protein